MGNESPWNSWLDLVNPMSLNIILKPLTNKSRKNSERLRLWREMMSPKPESVVGSGYELKSCKP